MAYVPAAHASFHPISRVRSFFANLRSTTADRLAFSRTYRELSRLTNRELADIGIRRCDISDIARGSIRCH